MWKTLAEVEGPPEAYLAIRKIYTRAHGEPVYEDENGPIWRLCSGGLPPDEQGRVGNCLRVNPCGKIEEQSIKSEKTMTEKLQRIRDLEKQLSPGCPREILKELISLEDELREIEERR